MRGRKSALTIVLTPADRAEIERWQRSTTGPAGLARRGRILLLLEGGLTLKDTAERCGMSVRHVRKWAERFRRHGLAGLHDRPLTRPHAGLFPPRSRCTWSKMACERPDDRGRSLALWDCREMARQLVAEAIVPSISADTVRRILEHHHLKPWRQHLWLSPKVPRDAAFAASVQEICDLYTRPLNDDEMVLCVDEKTNLQPRPAERRRRWRHNLSVPSASSRSTGVVAR